MGETMSQDRAGLARKRAEEVFGREKLAELRGGGSIYLVPAGSKIEVREVQEWTTSFSVEEHRVGDVVEDPDGGLILSAGSGISVYYYGGWGERCGMYRKTYVT